MTTLSIASVLIQTENLWFVYRICWKNIIVRVRTIITEITLDRNSDSRSSATSFHVSKRKARKSLYRDNLFRLKTTIDRSNLHATKIEIELRIEYHIEYREKSNKNRKH